MSAPPAILITSNFSNKTGFAWTAFFRVFNRIAREAHRRGLRVVLSFAEIDGQVDILDPDIPFEAIRFNPREKGRAELLSLARNIRRHNIRYAYLTAYPSWHWLYAFFRVLGIRRIVAHSHVSVASPHPAKPEVGLRRAWKALVHRIPYLAADHVLACSHFVRQRFVEKAVCPPERLTVLNYGLPDRQFLEPDAGRPDTDDAPVRIFCGARATRVKGVQHLIEATRLLAERTDLPEFEVAYAGDGPDLEAFVDLADGLGSRFRFLGFVDDTTEYLHQADIVVIPSVWGDAFPYSVLEALAAGKAVIASRAGGIPEQIGDESCGVLVSPGDEEELADALERLIRDPERRRRMGARAFQRARKRFRQEPYLKAVVGEVFRHFEIPEQDAS